MSFNMDYFKSLLIPARHALKKSEAAHVKLLEDQLALVNDAVADSIRKGHFEANVMISDPADNFEAVLAAAGYDAEMLSGKTESYYRIYWGE